MAGVTELLLAWSEGDDSALERLMPLVHRELREIAARQMRRERSGHTLCATALVNEAYLRLVKAQHVQWRNRAQFLAIAAKVMRQVLVDMARARAFDKRGGNVPRISFDETQVDAPQAAANILALDDALEALSKLDARKSRVIELRFFGGLTVEETAAALGVSGDTVMRDWRLAKSWLLRELRNDTHER